jgi:hypothetical protein
MRLIARSQVERVAVIRSRLVPVMRMKRDFAG